MEFKELLRYHSNCEIQGSKLKTGEGPGMILPGIGTENLVICQCSMQEKRFMTTEEEI